MGRVLAWGGGVVAGLALLVAAAAWLMPWTRLAQAGADRLSGHWGRAVTVQEAQVHWSWPPRIVLTGVTIANADWADTPHMAELPRVDGRLRLPPLLTGRLSFTDLLVVRPALWLQQGLRGERNWDFLAADPERDGPDLPRIDRLRVEEGRLDYRDAGRELALDARFALLDGTGGGTGGGAGADQGGGFRAAGTGTLAGAPLEVAVNGGPLLSLPRGDEPYPVELALRAGDTALRLQGAVAAAGLRGLDLAVQLEGPDMATLFPLTGIPLPPTAAYAVQGDLVRDGPAWHLRNLAGRVGDSDLAGWLTVEEREPRPLVRGELSSAALHLVDLGGLVGFDPDLPADQQGGDGRVLPRLQISTERLEAVDMDVHYQGAEVRVPDLLRDISFRFRLQDRVAEVTEARLRAATGGFTGALRLDARGEVPAAALEVGMTGLDFGMLFAGTRFADETSGRLGGRLRLEGPGSSLAEVMGSGTGRLTLILQDGQLSRLLLAGLSGDILDALGSLLGEDGPVPIRCGVGIGDIAGGLLRSDVLFIDTESARVRGDVTLNLKSEALAAEIEAEPKDGAPLTVPVLVEVSGSLSDAELALGNPEELALRGGAAAVLGALAGAAATILPFLGGEQAEDSPCGALIQEAAREEDGPALQRERAREAEEDG